MIHAPWFSQTANKTSSGCYTMPAGIESQME